LIENATVSKIDRELALLRSEASEPGQPPSLRTSAMTHIAWVPGRWLEAARETLAGLAERHPSRTILLVPHADDERNALDADVDLRCFAPRGEQRAVCSEVIEIHLLGSRASAPVSVVAPLLLPDLPVFCRWRGPLPFGAPELELLDAVDRLVVDSREWPQPDEAFARLPELCARVALSDIAWARTEPWRFAIAGLWPDVADASEIRVAGPEAEALLLARWLGTRLRRDVDLEHEPAGEIELVEVDGTEVEPARADAKSPSDLLSEQLEVYGRDHVYEEAVRSFSSVPT
jgi:glucose-6-phosphate dehydrogenase assembly protein OpcA